MKMRSQLGTVLACLALLLAGKFPCAAEARLEASLGFGGCTPPERWVPLRIRGEGLPGGASITVRRLASDGRSLGVESFPAFEGLLLECPVWNSGELEAVSVALGSGDRILAETKIDAKSKPFPGHLVLACGLSARARIAISSALMPVEPVLAVAVESRDLPSNGLDYDAVSAIAIGGGRIELSPAQRGALLAWLAGGGRLCLAESSRGAEALGLATGSGPSPGPRAYGFGIYATLSPDQAELPTSWREAFALEPYDPSSRLGAGSLARAPGARAAGDTNSSSRLARGAGESRAAIAAAAAAWLAALVLAAILGRGKAAPFAAVSAICLAAVLAGGPTLDKAIHRGAGASVRALVLPDSGAAFLGVGAEAYLPPESFDWAAVRAIGSPRLAYRDEESGIFGEWNHGMAKSAFGLRSGDRSGIELEAMLEPEEWEALSPFSIPSIDEKGPRRGGKEPPEIGSSLPLAFLASGQPASWWTKEPGGNWTKSKAAPPWLAADEGWILSLRAGKASTALLAGRCAADGFDFTVGGCQLGEIGWAMPLPEGRAR
jgi:hypothetical protein